jgi:hypothetical protein
MVIDVLAVLVQAHAGVEQLAGAVGLLARLAAPRVAFDAGDALAAAWREHQCDMVAGLEVVHTRTEFLHHAGGLVPQHHRQRPRPVAVDRGQVGVAQAGRLDLHQHLALAGFVELDFLDVHRPAIRIRLRQAHLPDHCGFHSHHLHLDRKFTTEAQRHREKRHKGKVHSGYSIGPSRNSAQILPFPVFLRVSVPLW